MQQNTIPKQENATFGIACELAVVYFHIIKYQTLDIEFPV